MKYLCRLMEIFVLSYFINENRNNFYMKTKLYICSQLNSLTPRTAIVREQKQFIKIAFAVHLSAAISAERYRSDSVALKSAVSVFVYFYSVLMVHKYWQSAKRKLLLNKNNLWMKS